MLNRRRRWHPTPVLLPGKSHGQRSLVGCGPWGCDESDTTERLPFHFSFSCIGEGNGNPLQCSCLENSRDGGAWWAAIYGVAQSRTRLKWVNSSSSSNILVNFHLIWLFSFLFNMDHLKNLYWFCYNTASVLCFGFFANKTCGILALPAPSIERWSFNHWIPREAPRSHVFNICLNFMHVYFVSWYQAPREMIKWPV